MDDFNFLDLKLIKKKDIIVDNKCKELEKLNELLVKVRISSFDEKVQNSNNGSGIEDIIQKIKDCENEVNEAVEDYIKFRKRCLRAVNSLGSDKLIDVAYKRYFEYKTFGQIAKEMNITTRWALDLNNTLLYGRKKV